MNILESYIYGLYNDFSSNELDNKLIEFIIKTYMFSNIKKSSMLFCIKQSNSFWLVNDFNIHSTFRIKSRLVYK